MLRRKEMVAPRHAARNLDIDEPVPDLVPAHGFTEHELHRPGFQRPADPQFAQGPVQPAQMAGHVHDMPAPDFTDFIDAVGELIAAVFDMDSGILVRNILAIDVSDAAHDFPFT